MSSRLTLFGTRNWAGSNPAKAGKREGAIGRLSKILVSQTHSQRQALRYLPVVLQKVGLPEEIRKIDRASKINGRHTARAAVVVNEVPERGVATARQKRERASRIEWRRLFGKLAQNLRAETKRVGALRPSTSCPDKASCWPLAPEDTRAPCRTTRAREYRFAAKYWPAPCCWP